MKASSTKCAGTWLVGILMITCGWYKTASPALLTSTALQQQARKQNIVARQKEQARAVYIAQNAFTALEERVVAIEKALQGNPSQEALIATGKLIEASTSLIDAAQIAINILPSEVPVTIKDGYQEQLDELVKRGYEAFMRFRPLMRAQELSMEATTVIPHTEMATAPEPIHVASGALQTKSDFDTEEILQMTAACFEKGLDEKTQAQRINDVYTALLIPGRDPGNWDFVQRIHKEIDAAQQVQKLLRIYIDFGITEYMKKTDESGRYVPEIEMELTTSFLDLVDPIIRNQIAAQISEGLNNLLSRAIDVYESKEITYAMDIEDRITSTLKLLGKLELPIKPKLQERFTCARFHHLIDRYFVSEPTEKEWPFLALYRQKEERKKKAAEEYVKDVRRRTIAMIEDLIQKRLELGFTPKMKRDFTTALGKLPSPIKEDLRAKFKEAQQQAGYIATIKMFIEQGSKEDAQSQLDRVKDSVIKAKLDAQIKQMEPQTASTK